MAENVVTPTTETEQQTTPTAEEVKQEAKQGKTPESIPYPRFQKVIQERNELEGRLKSIEEQLKLLEPDAKSYRDLVEYYNQNPDIAQKVREIYEGKKTVEEESFENEYLSSEAKQIKQLQQQMQELQKAQQKYEVEQLTQKLERELAVVENIISQKQLPIKREEIIDVMQKEGINSPQVALQVLTGRKMEDIIKSSQQKYINELKAIPPGSPSFGKTEGGLQQQTPRNWQEAREMMIKDLGG